LRLRQKAAYKSIALQRGTALVITVRGSNSRQEQGLEEQLRTGEVGDSIGDAWPALARR